MLCLAVFIGATVTVLLWKEREPTNSAWFWLCAVGYPVLGWSFLFISSLAHGHTVHRSALAQNEVSEQAEQACHVAASRPLAICGYGWRFSSDDEENSLQSILNGKVRSELRPSAAFPGKDVHARWIELPGEPFYPGNELGEYTRQLAVCDWLIARLLDDVSGSLTNLPTQHFLHVHLSLHSRINPEPVVEQLRRALKARRVPSLLRIEFEERLSIFATDDWLDREDAKTSHLVIAIQLRDAISEMLDDAAAEVGTALLLSDPRSKGVNAGALRLHRPASGKVQKVIEQSTRWGKAESNNLDTVWIQGSPTDDLGRVRGAANLDETIPWQQIEASVGDCSDAGAWLAVALATANADSTSSPQLVLNVQGDELTALVCRKET